MVNVSMKTLVAGFANGLVGIWLLENGRQLFSVRLHGAAAHLVLRKGKLHAGTELGQHISLDLSVFERSYCELVREVWASVPVVWKGGLPVRLPPPSGHRCRRSRRSQ